MGKIINMNRQENLEEQLELEFGEINKLADHGKLEKALERCNSLYCKHPEHPRVIHAMGLLKYRSGDLDEGEKLIREALLLRPDFADAYYNLGRILHLSMRNDEAGEVFRAGLTLKPDDPKQMIALTSILINQRHYREALALCHKVQALKPRLPEVNGQIGTVRLALGETIEALSFFRKELHRSSNPAIHSCILFVLNALEGISQEEIYRETVAWAKRHVPPKYFKPRGHFNVPDLHRKLRVGYVSGDFRLHPVGFHIELLLASYDKSRFEVFLYDTCPATEKMTKNLADHADHYRSIALKSDEVAEGIIRADGIDILVDLAGHTGMHRLMLFARRPAPIQVTWIGYFNTTGVEAIDYFIGDSLTNPPEEDHLFTEKVIRLPDNRFCYQARPYAPDVAPLPAQKNGYITFGSFNGIHKISLSVVQLWSRVLQAVPTARMILKFVFSDDDVTQRIRDQFFECGVSPERIEIRGESTHIDMLGEYGDIDICLDTFPFNGGITTCEALWMGAVVVTLAGSTPIGRQSKAYLYTIGHPEWVASSGDEYVAIAANLASDFARLADIRSKLRARMADSPLCDGKRFAGNLERAYLTMWHQWCSEKSHHLDVSAETTRKLSADELLSAGFNCMRDGDYPRTEQLFRRVIRRSPGHSAAYNNLAVLQKKQGRFNESLRSFRRAVKGDPRNIEMLLNLGRTLHALADYKSACKVLRQALAVEPDNCILWNALGTTLRFMGRLKESRAAFEQSLHIDPENIEALGHLPLVIGLYGDIQQSITLLKSAHELAPENHNTTSVLMAMLMYQTGTSQNEMYELGKCYEHSVATLNPAANSFSDLVLKEHLKVGFISPDFKEHPVGYLLVPLFNEFDRSRLSLISFNRNRGRSDSMTEWFRSSSSAWHEAASLDDDEMIALIRREQIDVLVDLSGHTNANSNCHSIFSRRAAPVQVAWIGYGHTTGLSEMDYIIADHEFIRPEDRQWFSEKPMFLTHNRFCFVPPSFSPEVTDAPCADNSYVTFGSFNNILKINEQVIAVWARILKQVPKSRLILKYKSLNDPDVRKYTFERFKQHGILPKRIELCPNSNLYFMLTEFGDVDISLDPFPFTGGMTTLFSLWMGVPVITLAGELPIGRQTKSFLDLIGLNEFVAYTHDEYVNKAVLLANDSWRLSSIRENIRQRMTESPLCDAKGYAAEVCDLFFKMWDEKYKNNYHSCTEFTDAY